MQYSGDRELAILHASWRYATITRMSGSRPRSSKDVVAAIRTCHQSLGRTPSRSEFIASSGISEYHVLQHFESWNAAVRAAGLEPNLSNQPIDDATLLADWADVVRRIRQIPTRSQYARMGSYSASLFDRRFERWSAVPAAFRASCGGDDEWQDVLDLVPEHSPALKVIPERGESLQDARPKTSSPRGYRKLEGRPTYGEPIDFRGLRHEPVNENGVVFLFGMVARELGYSVEAIQAGFPDCEAKRKIDHGRWQRVRIEFEFESRNFRDHGHNAAGCDVIVCWRHNWPECPSQLEIIELEQVIQDLGKSED